MEEKTSPLKELTTALEVENPPAEKLKLCLVFMRSALSAQPPNFRDFWEVQKRCLVLFKENLAAPERKALWEEYIELSKEVRRLRATLDEQASFAQEQIQLALNALEADLAAFNERIALISPLEFPANSKALAGKEETYNALQRKLTLLGQLASRVQELRKEVLASPMRARTKNSLLESLSKIGDGVFPQRKEAIGALSELYQSDVENFVAANFQEGRFKNPFYELKDEIRAFQALAKQLTLNTAVFQKTRAKLSECWDQVRAKEEERKKQKAEKPAREERPKKVRMVEEPKIKEPPRLSAQVEALLERSSRAENEDRLLQEESRAVLEEGDETLLTTQLDKLAKRRKEIKELLEQYRKTAGGSALNFEESMRYRELIEQDRMRLDEIEMLMQEIQDKLYS